MPFVVCLRGVFTGAWAGDGKTQVYSTIGTNSFATGFTYANCIIASVLVTFHGDVENTRLANVGWSLKE